MYFLEVLFLAVISLAMLSILPLWAASVSWAVNDARRRGQSPGWIVLLLWLAGPLAAPIWWVVRPASTLAERPTLTFNNPEDALFTASRLDSDGDWDQAIKLYQHIAQAWPEHAAYVKKSIEEIEKKKMA